MKFYLLAFTILMVCVSSATANVYSITFEPTIPAVGDSVVVTVYGNVPSTSWSFVGQNCGMESANEIVIGISTYDCIGRECTSQGWAFSPFQAVCTYVFDDPGVYVIRAIETKDSIQDNVPSELVAEIGVLGAVATKQESWSTIKAIFR